MSMDLNKINELWEDWFSMKHIERETWTEYFRIRRHLISSNIIKSWDAQKRESLKREKKKKKLVDKIISMRKDWKSYKHISQHMWISITTCKRYGRYTNM